MILKHVIFVIYLIILDLTKPTVSILFFKMFKYVCVCVYLIFTDKKSWITHMKNKGTKRIVEKQCFIVQC